MPGSAYFLTLAGLGVSFAGFAGLIAALDRRPDAHSPVRMWRIRNIVADGFMLTVVGLGVIAVHDASRGNVELAVRFGSLLYVVRYLFVLKPSNTTGQAWNETSRLGWWWAVVSVALGVLFFAISAILARVGFFQVLFFVQLAGPITTFNNAIRDLASDPEPLEDQVPEP